MAKSKINFGRKKVFLENLSKYLTLPLNEDSKYLLSLSFIVRLVAFVCFVKELECALGLIVGVKFVIVIVKKRSNTFGVPFVEVGGVQ